MPTTLLSPGEHGPGMFPDWWNTRVWTGIARNDEAERRPHKKGLGQPCRAMGSVSGNSGPAAPRIGAVPRPMPTSPFARITLTLTRGEKSRLVLRGGGRRGEARAGSGGRDPGFTVVSAGTAKRQSEKSRPGVSPWLGGWQSAWRLYLLGVCTHIVYPFQQL